MFLFGAMVLGLIMIRHVYFICDGLGRSSIISSSSRGRSKKAPYMKGIFLDTDRERKTRSEYFLKQFSL